MRAFQTAFRTERGTFMERTVVRLVGRASSLVSAKLGRCAKCWRSSLRWAVAGWLGTAVVYALGPAMLRPLILLWPLSFTALWIAHAVTFTTRVVGSERALRHERPDERANAGGHDAPVSLGSPFARGTMLRLVVKSVLVMVAASVSVPVFTARADAACECNDKLTCCGKQVATKCCFNPARGEYFCVPPDSTCCGSPSLSWHCEGQTPNCNGDGTSTPYCR